MSGSTDRIKMARPGEPEAVKTTIVGGQPPREGRSIGNVPRGVEVLVKKAAVDPAFKKTLLEKRAAAAEAIALKLEPAEVAMLNAIPLKQLETTVANTKVSPKLRPVFLGCTAAVMLAALGALTLGCGDFLTKGHDPSTAEDWPPAPADAHEPSEETAEDQGNGDEEVTAEDEATDDTKPGDQVARGVRPDRP